MPSERPVGGVDIALLRHFPTDWNVERRLTGRADRPLTDEARARLATLALPPPWDAARIVASTLGRAVETAEALARGRDVARDPRLVEQDWGAWQGRRADDLAADPDAGYVPPHLMAPEHTPPDGESAAAMRLRLGPALAEIAARGEPAVVVCHKGVMRRLLAEALGTAAEDPAAEIRRARLYPMRVDRTGRVFSAGPAIRLVARGLPA